jgi:hypothetical protein
MTPEQEKALHDALDRRAGELAATNKSLAQNNKSRTWGRSD